MKTKLLCLVLTGLALAAPLSQAAETPIGKHQIVGGMEIGAVYLQPVKMEPDGMMKRVEESDIRLEADIHATKKNPNGFSEGYWMPNLVIKFEITKVGSRSEEHTSELQ